MNIIIIATYFHRIPFADWPLSPIHLRSILCDGTESNITSCRHTSVTSIDSTITHGQDVFVVCRPHGQQSYSGGDSFYNNVMIVLQQHAMFNM